MTSIMKERVAWICLCGILVFVCINVMRQSTASANQAERHTILTGDFREQFQWQISRMQARLEKAEADAHAEEAERTLAYLKDRGLKDPAHDLAADLKKHPELLPYSGNPGEMRSFQDPMLLRTLGAHWAAVAFRNEHGSGQLLLRFDVSGGGKITWKALDAYHN